MQVYSKGSGETDHMVYKPYTKMEINIIQDNVLHI